MQNFETVKAALLSHLPRPAVAGNVEVTTGGVEVRAPGVSIGDLARLLFDLTGEQRFLPRALAIEDLRLERLRLTRFDEDSLDGPHAGFDLAFTVSWSAVSLMLADGFPLTLAEVVFEKRGRRLTATAAVELSFNGHRLDASLELPAQVVHLRLDDAAADNARALLEGRGLLQADGRAKVDSLAIAASLPFQHVVLHVEASNLFTIGPVHLARAAAEVIVAGRIAASSIEVDAEVEIETGSARALRIAVSGAVDAHGWRLAGTLDAGFGDLTIGRLVESLAGSLGTTTASLPSFVAELKLAHLGIAIDTHDQSFELDCTLDWSHEGHLRIHLEKAGEQLLVTGTLQLGDVVFELALEGGDAAVLVGSFDAAQGKKLTLDDLLAAVSIDAPFGPGGSGVTIGLRAAGMAFPDTRHVLLAADLDAGIDLAKLGELPLLGTLMPKEQKLGIDVAAYFMSDGFKKAQQDKARKLLPDTLHLPDRLATGPHVAARLQLGGPPIDLPALDGVDSGAPPKIAHGGKPAATRSAASPITWQKIGRSIGPLRIDRAGYAIETEPHTAVELVLDAEIETSGLTLSLDGLGAHYDFASRTLAPRLAGLGLDVKQGAIEVSGAFLNVDGDFAGKAVIKTEAFALSALGGFTMLDGAPSMFAYGRLDMPLGGPVFFFVEGLAAGVGVHRLITMPSFDEVRSFPLVAGAIEAATGSPAKPDPGEELRKLHHYIAPKLGEYFLAVGVKFNSFKLLNGFLVIIARAGKSVEVDLIGTASFESPPALPKKVPALARIDLDLEGRFRPADGFLGIQGRINPKSYVYGPPCHLSGEFAFFTWLAGRHAGDFVLTVGGYHPRFKRPAHYPKARRIELKYKINKHVYLKGDAYFAMTPAVMMAGGGLHANVEIGRLHATADFTVDFIVAWEPFHYDAKIHIGIAARYRCFHTHATADLHIWGPPFSGLAEVSWFIFSFDIAFGSKGKKRPRPISTAEFKKSFLDIDGTRESVNAMLGIVPTAGVIGETASGTPILAGTDLVLRTSTRLPTTAVTLGEQDPIEYASSKLGIAPVGGKSLGRSAQTIKIERDGKPAEEHFTHRELESGFPAALWSTQFPVELNARPIEAVAGFELRPKHPPKAGATAKMEVGKLQYRRSKRRAARFFPTTPPRNTPPSEARLLAELERLGLEIDELSNPTPPVAPPPITLGTSEGPALA